MLSSWHELTQNICRKISKILSTDDSARWDVANTNLEESLKYLDEKINDLLGNYDAIEKQLQRYESEIRKHIRTEQQIKLYAESVQSKYEESESTRFELLENTKKMINSLKKENEAIFKKLQYVEEENKELKKSLFELEDQQRKHHNQDRFKEQQSAMSKYSTIDQVSHSKGVCKNFISEKTDTTQSFNINENSPRTRNLQKLSNRIPARRNYQNQTQNKVLKQQNNTIHVENFAKPKSQQRVGGASSILNTRKINSRQEEMNITGIGGIVRKGQSVDNAKLFNLQKKLLNQTCVNGTRTYSNQDYTEFLEQGL